MEFLKFLYWNTCYPRRYTKWTWRYNNLKRGFFQNNYPWIQNGETVKIHTRSNKPLLVLGGLEIQEFHNIYNGVINAYFVIALWSNGKSKIVSFKPDFSWAKLLKKLCIISFFCIKFLAFGSFKWNQIYCSNTFCCIPARTVYPSHFHLLFFLPLMGAANKSTRIYRFYQEELAPYF